MDYVPYDERYFPEVPVFHPYPYEPVQPTETREDDRQDYGNRPYVVNIEEAAERNRHFRRAIWTGRHLQVTLMSLRPGEDIGLEVHPHTDQFLRIEEGRGLVAMGRERNNLTFRRRVREDDAIMVPAGMWHNLTNTGDEPLKLYSIYAPPEHPHGTIHRLDLEEGDEEK